MDNDFIVLFKQLNSIEQKEFSQYIRHFYAPQKAVIAIFDAVVLYLEKSDNTLLEILEKKKKNTQNDLSDLKQWLIEFLTIQEIKSNSLEAQFLTLKALRKRKLHTIFMQKADKISLKLANHPSPDIWQLMEQLRIKDMQYFQKNVDYLQNYEQVLVLLSNDLDSFYVAAKLKYAVESYSRKEILDEAYPIQLADEIATFMGNKKALNPIIDTLYLPILALVKDKSTDAYRHLKMFIETDNPLENVDKSRKSVQKLSVLRYLLNFASTQIKQNDMSYCDEYLNLVKEGITQRLFTTEDFFPTQIFINIVNVANHLKAYDWVNTFIENYEKTLDPNDANDSVKWAKARIKFDQNEFGQVLELLREIPDINMGVNINLRILKIRAFVELKEQDSLILDNLKALYAYTMRAKNIGDDFRHGILNFIKILRALLQKKPKSTLIGLINNTNSPIVCIDWLTSKIEIIAN